MTEIDGVTFIHLSIVLDCEKNHQIDKVFESFDYVSYAFNKYFAFALRLLETAQSEQISGAKR